MPFCPNPECPYLKKTKQPAEFGEGVTVCSDCGSPLAPNAISPEKKIEVNKPLLSDLQRRLLYTLGMLALWRALSHIAVPGIDFEGLDKFLFSGAVVSLFGFGNLSVFALGLMPYISAYIIVEVLALFVKPLKSWRQGGYHGREKLRKAALMLALVLAAVQSYAIYHGLGGLVGGQFIIHSGIMSPLIFCLTLIAGTFITIWIAEMITIKGIGQGISVLIFAGISAQFITSVSSVSKIPGGPSLFEEIFFYLIILAIAVAIIVFMERSRKNIPVQFDDTKKGFLSFKLTTAGVVPAEWALSFILLPATLAGFIDNPELRKIAMTLSSGGVVYSILLFVFIIIFYFLFTASFYNPRKIVDCLTTRGAQVTVPSGRSAESYINYNLGIMACAGALYLFLLTVLPDILFRHLGIVPLAGGISLIIAGAVGLDLIQEIRARRSGSLLKIAEIHDLPKAGVIKSLLEQQGIQCHLQGYYHRALLYFFGPYIEISVMVPVDLARDAAGLISKYVDESVLLSEA
jgi:preprotein translocase subunit SecY